MLYLGVVLLLSPMCAFIVGIMFIEKAFYDLTTDIHKNPVGCSLCVFKTISVISV